MIYSILDQSFNKAEVAQSSSLCISLEDIENQKITDTKQQKYVVSYFIRENDHKYDNTCILEIESLIKKKVWTVEKKILNQANLLNNKELDSFVTRFLEHDKQHLYRDDIVSYKTKANGLVYQQLHSQLENLSISKETAPQLLHLVSLLLFQNIYHLPLYVSGKFVPAILAEIKPSLKEDEQDLLHKVHMSVMGQQENNDALFTTLKKLGISCQQE